MIIFPKHPYKLTVFTIKSQTAHGCFSTSFGFKEKPQRIINRTTNTGVITVHVRREAPGCRYQTSINTWAIMSVLNTKLSVQDIQIDQKGGNMKRI